jgi:hypothetical protein
MFVEELINSCNRNFNVFPNLWWKTKLLYIKSYIMCVLTNWITHFMKIKICLHTHSISSTYHIHFIILRIIILTTPLWYKAIRYLAEMFNVIISSAHRVTAFQKQATIPKHITREKTPFQAYNISILQIYVHVPYMNLR